MNQGINKHVARVVVEFAIFLEFSGSDTLNPDVAMQGLDQLASTLQMMDLKSKLSLCSQFKSIAIEYSDEQADFVEGLGEALGLIDE